MNQLGERESKNPRTKAKTKSFFPSDDAYWGYINDAGALQPVPDRAERDILIFRIPATSVFF